MEPFNPVKRIEPQRQDRNTGSGALPSFQLPQQATSPIDAFAKLLGVVPKAFEQYNEEQREEQTRKAAEIVKEKENELGELYQKYRKAEQAGEIPPGYSPFLLRAVRQNIGARMGRKVSEELSTVVLDGIRSGELAADDLDDVYDRTVGSVLQREIGVGSLDDVDSDFYLAYTGEEERFRSAWMKQAYEAKGEVRLAEAGKEFEAGLDELVKTGYESPQELENAIIAYKSHWKSAGFPKGWMEESIVAKLADRVEYLTNMGAYARDPDAAASYLEQARSLMETARDASTNPYSKVKDGSHTMGARYSEAFNEMDERIARAQDGLDDGETRGRALTATVASVETLVRVRLEGSAHAALNEDGTWNDEEVGLDRDSIRKRADPDKLLTEQELDGIIAEAKRKVASDYLNDQATLDERARRENIQATQREGRQASRRRPLGETGDVNAFYWEEIEKAEAAKDYDRADALTSAHLAEIEFRNRARQQGVDALSKAVPLSSVFTIQEANFSSLVEKWLPNYAGDETKMGAIRSAWETFHKSEYEMFIQRKVNELSPMELDRIGSDPDYVTGIRDEYLRTSNDTFRRFVETTDIGRTASQENAAMGEQYAEFHSQLDDDVKDFFSSDGDVDVADAVSLLNNDSGYLDSHGWSIRGPKAALLGAKKAIELFTDSGTEMTKKRLKGLRQALDFQDSFASSKGSNIRNNGAGRFVWTSDKPISVAAARALRQLNASRLVSESAVGGFGMGTIRNNGFMSDRGTFIYGKEADPTWTYLVPNLTTEDDGTVTADPAVFDEWTKQMLQTSDDDAAFRETDYGRFFYSLPEEFRARPDVNPQSFLLLQATAASRYFNMELL